VARAFAVIDVWITLCSDRPYRKAWNKERALQYLVKQAGTQFDPSIVEAFVALLPHAEEDSAQTPSDQLVLPGMSFYPSIMTR